MKKIILTRTFFMCGLVVITSIAVAMNVQASPSTPNWGCHDKGNYTISANVSSIECDPGSKYGLEIIATGTVVVVDVYSGALDNDVFTISPGNIITDGGDDDTNPATGAITVILEITMPSSDGRYTLRILSRQTTLEGEETDMEYLDLEVTVGIVIEPPLLLLLENYNLFVGGFAVISIFFGTFVFKIDSSRSDIPIAHRIFMTIAFILTMVNIFLILNDTMYIVNSKMVLTFNQYLGQFNHIFLGSIGFLAGIVVISGTYTNVPESKLKLAAYIMFIGWTFNFLNGILISTPTYNFGSLF